jgi:hypothetical protein
MYVDSTWHLVFGPKGPKDSQETADSDIPVPRAKTRQLSQLGRSEIHLGSQLQVGC